MHEIILGYQGEMSLKGLNRNQFESAMMKILRYRQMCIRDRVFSVEIPNFIELEVTQTEPGVKGNTATNTLKPATVETGAEIRVPLFINEGDHIRIDTRTGEYMERV